MKKILLLTTIFFTFQLFSQEYYYRGMKNIKVDKFGLIKEITVPDLPELLPEYENGNQQWAEYLYSKGCYDNNTVILEGGDIHSCKNSNLSNLDANYPVNLSMGVTDMYRIHFYNNQLINVNELRDLESVNYLYIDSNSLQNIDGLFNLKIVRNDIDVQYNNITNLDGLQNLKSVGGNLNLYDNNIEDVSGLNKLEYVGF